MRERWRNRLRRPMARPLADRPQMPEPGPGGRIALGWVGAGLIVALMAFIVGRPSGDAGESGSRPSAAPSASSAPLPITFGGERDTTSLEVVRPADTFRRGEVFAYSVPLPGPVGSDTVYVRVDRAGDPPTTVQDWAEGAQTVDPSLPVISFEVPADALLDAFGAGEYRMRMSLASDGGTPLAEGWFRLVEDPVAS